MVFVCPDCLHQKNSIDCYGCDPIEMRCCKCHSPLLSTSDSYRCASPVSSIGSVDSGPSVPPRSGKSWPTNIFADFGESDKQEEVEKWQAGDGWPIRHSTSDSPPGLDNSVSSYRRYLYAPLAGPDADFPMEETSGFRKPNLGDPVPSDCSIFSGAGRRLAGMRSRERRPLDSGRSPSSRRTSLAPESFLPPDKLPIPKHVAVLEPSFRRTAETIKARGHDIPPAIPPGRSLEEQEYLEDDQDDGDDEDDSSGDEFLTFGGPARR